MTIALSSLADGEAARTNEITKHVSVGAKTTNAILNHLNENGVATKAREGRGVSYALDREALRDRVRIVDQREEIQRRREELTTTP